MFWKGIKMKSNFVVGNIVKWDNELWVVEKYETKPKKKVCLISAEHSNYKACITTTWPLSKTKRINSIEWIAQSMRDFITDEMLKIFGWARI